MLEEINLINKLLENTIFHKCKSEGINKKGDIIIIINIGITPPPPGGGNTLDIMHGYQSPDRVDFGGLATNPFREEMGVGLIW